MIGARYFDWRHTPGLPLFTAAMFAFLYVALRKTRIGLVIQAALTHPQTVEALGLRALEIPCHPDTGMDVDALAQRHQARPFTCGLSAT